jgi:hypothetical protein
MAPICTDCISGSLHTGTPKGHTELVHGIQTYVTKPSDGTPPKALIILISDAFGWSIPNSRLLADGYAEKGGFMVYVPDFMNGLLNSSFFLMKFYLRTHDSVLTTKKWGLISDNLRNRKCHGTTNNGSYADNQIASIMVHNTLPEANLDITNHFLNTSLVLLHPNLHLQSPDLQFHHLHPHRRRPIPNHLSQNRRRRLLLGRSSRFSPRRGSPKFARARIWQSLREN